MTEKQFEKLLCINTIKEQKNFNESIHYNRYEATPYNALDLFFKEYPCSSTDYIIDFGCGKGRLAFFANHFYNANVTGIEMNVEYYNSCLDNKSSYISTHPNTVNKIHFINDFAQKYSLSAKDNKFYFFNPFSVQIFINVINNILISFEKFQRNIDIILYYPSDDYIYHLENFTPFKFEGSVKIPMLFDKDSRELFLVYRLT